MKLFKHTKTVEDGIIEMTDAKVMYTGIVKSVHNGFSYINDVRRGYESINTNGDVFIPQHFDIGKLVEFEELNTDPKRPGKFRAECAKEVNGALVTAGNQSVGSIRELSEKRNRYHKTAKKIDISQSQKASENEPFSELLGIYREDYNIDIKILATEFLRSTYANLESIGIEYEIDVEINKTEEEEIVREAIRIYEQSEMHGQIESVQQEYNSFKGVRDVFHLMYLEGILNMQSVIPIKYLPDLLVASPVWFVDSKNNLQNMTGHEDPEPDHAIQFFCDTVKTKEFAWLYQIYNRRTRPINTFKGRDIMPLPLVKILDRAKKTFDYVVIATPYHDIASKEWEDPNWLRNIDPFLFGFVKNLPYMFLLGRWSGTGLFPLMCDMIADTMNHLSLNKDKLIKFRKDSYWYNPIKNHNNESISFSLEKNNGRGDYNTVLTPFAEKVIRRFEEGKLFEFLRGEVE